MLGVSEKHLRYVSIGIFGVIFALILLTFKDYGVTWDEELQSQYGQAVYDYYISGLHDDRFQEIFNLYLYGGMFDGLAAFVNQYTPFQVYESRHLLNAIVGLIGLWGTWRLGRWLGGSAVGLAALILCATTPMYYGHMFNNPKDIPFAAGVVWSMYYMFRFYSRPSLPVIIKLGLILGLTLGVRVGGIMLLAYWAAPIGFAALLTLRKNHDQQTIKDTTLGLLALAVRFALPAAVIAYGVMLICWPWAQEAPIRNPLRALSEFSNFPQNVEVLLNGTTYMSTKLPWYYVPMYFGIQLPEITLILGVITLVFLPKIWAGLSLARRQALSLLLLMVSFPVFYAVLRHPALYDTVRHFLFVVPLLSVFCALGLRELYYWLSWHINLRPGLLTSILSCAIAVPLILQVGVMIRLHPYQYIYANQLTGGVDGAYGKFESDYWGSSFKEAAEMLQQFVAKEGGVPPGKIFRVAICGPWSAATIYLPPDFSAVQANDPAEFFLATTRWMCQNMRPGENILQVQRMGVPLSIVKDLRDGYEFYDGNKEDWNKPQPDSSPQPYDKPPEQKAKTK